ncbi:hypothetical protein LTR08_002119 [Meristemomyces frigidus]|nr:hypothetical protein LTR08_002119 [Meristemomyces frigidus]
MDRSNNGAYSRTLNIPRALEARASTESQSSRLRKKRSNVGGRTASHPLWSAASSSREIDSTSGSVAEAGKKRKSSLRNAVRRIFSRGSKEDDSEPHQNSPPRHGYHRSEPSILSPHIEDPETSQREDYAPLRTLAAPLQIVLPEAFGRIRSPYAVEFPQSARLKPLDLGNPFSAPGSQLRRRQTLPSVLISESEAAALSTAISAPHPPPLPHPRVDLSPTLTPENIRARKAKRRSRSADDMRRTMARQRPSRKRSDEIKYWRESFQPSILRASGCESKGSLEEDTVEDQTAQSVDPFFISPSRSGAFKGSPSFHRGSPSVADMGSVSRIGSELSRDLEDRVAKLEAGLQHFQRSLQRLANERNRRTLVMGGVPQARPSSDARTPSMLADTLAQFAPSTYQFDFGHLDQRPVTSPEPPQTPIRSSEVRRPPVPAMPTSQYPDELQRTPSPPFMTALLPPDMPPANFGGGGGNIDRSSQPQQHSFNSLYDMLADERSARRRVETQVRDMRQQIIDLQYQVSVDSRIQSHRGSFGPLGATASSGRLRDMLRESETYPTGTAQSAQRGSNNTGFSSLPPGMVSRFSGSSSETGAAESAGHELATPYEAYQTPMEDRNRFYFGDHRGSEDDMF